jgi:hypothetical protein
MASPRASPAFGHSGAPAPDPARTASPSGAVDPRAGPFHYAVGRGAQVFRAHGPGRRTIALSELLDRTPPRCLWPDSHRHLENNLGGLPERLRRKITGENVAKLYRLPPQPRPAP